MFPWCGKVFIVPVNSEFNIYVYFGFCRVRETAWLLAPDVSILIKQQITMMVSVPGASVKHVYVISFCLVLSTASLISGCVNPKFKKMYEGDVEESAKITSLYTVKIERINGRETGINPLGMTRTYGVPPGRHTVIVSYFDFKELNNRSHKKLVSRPIKLTFDMDANKTYQVGHRELNDLEGSIAFAREPVFRVSEIEGNKKVAVVVESSMPVADQGTFGIARGYEFRSDDRVVSTRVGNQAQASVPPPPPGLAGSIAVRDGIDSQPADDEVLGSGGSMLEVLKLSWKNASKEERQKFLEWMIPD